MIAQGFNSGYQAVNLAALAGAARIVLIGFDMAAAPDGRRHFFGDHPEERMNAPHPFGLFLTAFARAAPVYAARGIEVVNASRATALDSFPRVGFEEFIAPFADSGHSPARATEG